MSVSVRIYKHSGLLREGGGGGINNILLLLLLHSFSPAAGINLAPEKLGYRCSRTISGRFALIEPFPTE